MNKNILKVAFVAAIAMLSGITVYNSLKSEIKLSDVAMANVEALANNEKDYSAKVWYRHDYTLDNGKPAVNCVEIGSDDCLLK